MRAFCLALTLGAAAMAQSLNQGPPPMGHRVDAVVATVNDSAILFSTLRMLAVGKVEAQVAKFGSIGNAERDAIFREVLEAEINRQRMAQSAKSLGPIPPEQVDQIIRSEFERERQAQVRDLGSLNELSHEMKRIGRTWPAYEREQRIDKLSEIAEELAVGRRLGKQQNLFLTPRMLREAYEQYRGRFVHEGAAKVVQVRFTGDQAKANAEAAAEAWRKESNLDARQLSARFPPSQAIGEVVARDLSAQLADITAFALAGPEGAVSAPVAIGNDFLVARVSAHIPDRSGQFEDAEVQDELRNICFQQVVREFKAQAMLRAHERTEVWPPQNAR